MSATTTAVSTPMNTAAATPVLDVPTQRTPPPSPARGRVRPGLTLTVVCITTVMLMLDIAVVNTALTRIAHDLHTDLPGVQWVVDAYTLALAALVLSAGSLADRIGRRRVLVGGLVLFTGASLGCATATSTGALDLARAVQGAGAAALFAVSLALLGHAFPDKGAREAALATYGAAIGASFAVGPLVGGLLTQHLGWRWIFLVNVPVGLACLVLTRYGVVESRDPHPRRLDPAGQVLLTVGLFLLVLGLLRGNADGWTSRTVLASLLGGAVLLAAFLAVERVVADPMLPASMFTRAFTGTQVAAFAISSSLFAVFLYTTLYLQGVLGLSPVQAGAVYLPGMVLMVGIAMGTAKVLTRLPAGTALAGSLVVVAAGLALSNLGGVHSSWLLILPGLVISCGACGVFNPVMSGLVLSESDPARAGLAAGINDSFRQTGIALGVAALGALVPPDSAFGGDPAAYVHGLHLALWVATGIAAVGAAVAAVLLRRR